MTIQYSRGLELSLTEGGGDAIPDSAIHRWTFSEGSGSTTADLIGTADMSLSGVTFASGTWVDDFAGSGDGTDDYGDATTLGGFGSAMDTDFAIALTVQTTDTIGNSTLCGTYNDNLTTALVVGNATDVFLLLRGDNDNEQKLDINTTTLEDGNPHRVVINKTGTAASDINVFFDGTEQTTSVDLDQSPSTFSNFQYPFTFLARNVRGSIDKHLNGIIDEPIIFGDSLTSQQIADDYQRQPWS